MKQYAFFLVFLCLGLVAHAQSAADADTGKMVVIGHIRLQGNDVTRDKIILRELEYKSGDTLSVGQFDRLTKLSRNNLLNRSLFNFVDIDAVTVPGFENILDVEVKMTERWYVWPLPIFELADRNFNAWWKSRDFSRVNYGFFLTHNNFRGRMELLKLLIRAGYDQNYYLTYEVPYLTKKQNFGIGIQAGYQRSRQIAFNTVADQQVNIKEENRYAKQASYGKLMVSYRKGYRQLHQFYVGYENFLFSDTVLRLNPDFIRSSNPRMEFLSMMYIFKLDYRDSKPYPLNGNYFELELSKTGFGLFKTAPNFYYVKTTFDWYTQIAKRWHWASNLTSKFSGGGFQPYFLTRGLGYGNDFVRSYELYVIDGQGFGLLKNNLKYTLLKPRVRNLPLIKTDKFRKIHFAMYMNLFFDAAYVDNNDPGRLNLLQNKLIYGSGVGIDLVTYYDLVFRLEYSVNREGETGFFINFVAPI